MSYKNKNNSKIKICLISSSGGHFEQLKMLKPLSKNPDFEVFWVTEDANYGDAADYFLRQTQPNKVASLFIMFVNTMRTLRIWCKERPDYVITTGTLIALPMALLARLLGKRLVYIETFARVYDGTRAGKLFYKFADLFIIQWETLKDIYPNAVYGGSIY